MQEHLVLVTELLRANLYEFQRYNRESGDEPYFSMPRIQSIARQVRAGPACGRAGRLAGGRRRWVGSAMCARHLARPVALQPPPNHRPPSSPSIALHHRRQVLSSLSFLHSLGLVHADLKPENILVKSYSKCQVMI